MIKRLKNLSLLDLFIGMALGMFAAFDVYVAQYYSLHTAWLMVLVFAWGMATCTLCWLEFFDRRDPGEVP